MLRKLYLSPLGILISWAMNAIAFAHRPFMVYGHFNRKRSVFRKHTRIASNATLVEKAGIDLADHVWIGYNCHIDGVGGVTIGEGVNVASHSCIYTHSSHQSIRILGSKFIETEARQRPGYILESVEIGDYTFIGTGCTILPGTTLGRGCVVGAGSVVKGNFPDQSILAGNPAKVFGSTLDSDAELLQQGVDFSNYYAPHLIDTLKSR